jgi:glucose/arabinose dehydrogenase/cytochrome c5
MRTLCTVALASLFVAVAVVVAQREEPGPGAKTYSTYCAGCHGTTLSGGRAPTLFDDVWHFGGDDASVRQSITEGRAGTEMAPFKSILKDEDITAVIAYLRAQSVLVQKSASRAQNPAGQLLQTEKAAVKIEVVAEGLSTPWGMAFLPDGRLLVTERPGTLRIVDINAPGAPAKPPSKPIEGIPAVWAQQDGGLFDVAPHPEYARDGNGWIYLSYAEPGPDNTSMTAIVRGRIKDGKWVDQQVLFHAAPKLFYPTNIHYGSRFTFDKQGHLFYSIGDRGHDVEAQDLAMPNGKIHRLNDDGSIPRDNPFVGRAGALESIWSYGHRNPQGLAWHPVTGKLWEAEHGPTGGDELNRIEPGRNYGWPVITNGINLPRPNQPGGQPAGPPPQTTHEGMESPITSWTPAIAPSGIAFYTGNKIPAWTNSLFVTGLGGEALRRLETDGDKVTHEEVIFKGFGRVRQAVVGPDGLLYVALSVPGVRLSDPTPGLIIRLVPAERSQSTQQSPQPAPQPAPQAAPQQSTPPETTPAPAGGGGRPRNPNADVGADFTPKPAVQALSPADEARHFVMPPGYHLELVLSEPDVINPVAIAFDGNGRMFVAEMRSYMMDADGTNEYDAISRISLHESTKGDGTFDKHTVFLDKVVLPRMVLPLDKSILTMETDADDVYQYWDTNGDGVADKKELFFRGAGRQGNLEHQPSGFIWALDNWIYSTYNAMRFRWTPEGMKQEPTAPNGGQWGLTQDDYGKVWFVDAGGERGPINFQTPIQYGGFNVSDQFEPDFELTWPLGPGISDMQGGMLRVRMPIGVLNHFTAACGQDIYRGDRLPADLRGDLLFAEPVARIIRRSKIVVTEGLTQLRNAYPKSEFILSTDPLFRPVNLITAPDGTIYLVDMYHGIVQESEWTPPGSYLRRKIEQYQLDKVKGYGRIWRLVHDGMEPNHQQPRMLDETPAQLVAHLDNPNGWWRDTAQRLLVLRQDKSVVPALQDMVRSSQSLLARFGALWTLEGLSSLDASLLREELKDPNPEMRIQALRASESLYKAGDISFEKDIRAAVADTDTKVVIQAMLTLNVLKVPDAKTVVRTAQRTNKSRGVQEIGNSLLRPAGGGFGFGGRNGPNFFTPEQQTVMQRGAAIYTELCYACHGTDGRGAPMAGAPAGTMMAPSLAGSPRVLGHRDYVLKVLLHGLSGPIDGNTYPGVMVSMATNKDDWIASIGSFVRNSFGNRGAFITPDDVARVRTATADRKTMWTPEAVLASLPSPVGDQKTWKATASDNPDAAARALLETGAGWFSGKSQQSDAWYQIELPKVTTVTEIEFDSPAPPGGGSGGPPPRVTNEPQTGNIAPNASGAERAAARRNATGGGIAGFLASLSARAGYPRAYKVQVSLDGTTWSPPVAEGHGAPTTIIAFAPVRAKFVRITQTASPESAPAWSIQRLKLYQSTRLVASH